MDQAANIPLGETELMFALFTPATKPDRLEKAACSGATFVIADLEDAVATTDKVSARSSLSAFLTNYDGSTPICVRINSADTEWFEKDLAMVLASSAAGVILPKAEKAVVANTLRQTLPEAMALFGLIETAKGIAGAREIAPHFDRLMFGSIDYAADLGCGHNTTALAHARSELVLAAKLAGQYGPIDGVTPEIRDTKQVEEDAAFALNLGFSGKLLIHPSQIAPAKNAYRPTSDEISWANRVVQSVGNAGVVSIDGVMIDAPVIKRAEQVLQRATATSDS